jgi:arabinose-5-phosphate isomerase
MKAPVGTSELAFLAEVIEAESTALGSMARGLRGGSSDCNGWTRALDLLESCTGHVVVAGLGKSGLIGAKISATLASLGQPSHVIHPSEAVHGDLGRMREGDIALLLSYSGETAEVIDLALHLKADGIARIGISCRATTNLARLCDAHVSVGDIVEACPLNLAPTASTTAMLAAGDALALALARRRNFQADDFHRHHPGGMLGAGLRQITEVLRFRVGNNLTVVSDSVTVRKALAAAGEGRRAGAIMLVDADGRLSGIFTDGDLRRLVNGGGLEALDSLVSTVMTARPTCLTVDALVRDAVRLVQEKRLDEIPVVDLAGKPLGLVDVQDLISMRVVEG